MKRRCKLEMGGSPAQAYNLLIVDSKFFGILLTFWVVTGPIFCWKLAMAGGPEFSSLGFKGFLRVRSFHLKKISFRIDEFR